MTRELDFFLIHVLIALLDASADIVLYDSLIFLDSSSLGPWTSATGASNVFLSFTPTSSVHYHIILRILLLGRPNVQQIQCL